MTFTQKTIMHLNGGSHYSVLYYRVYGDGEELPITHYVRTDGRPKYLVLEDRFSCTGCGAEFDRMAGHAGLLDWLAGHAGCPAPAAEATGEGP